MESNRLPTSFIGIEILIDWKLTFFLLLLCLWRNSIFFSLSKFGCIRFIFGQKSCKTKKSFVKYVLSFEILICVMILWLWVMFSALLLLPLFENTCICSIFWSTNQTKPNQQCVMFDFEITFDLFRGNFCVVQFYGLRFFSGDIFEACKWATNYISTSHIKQQLFTDKQIWMHRVDAIVVDPSRRRHKQ